MTRIAAILWLAGCQGPRDGTAVGNPTMDAELARVSGGHVQSATLPVARIRATDCANDVLADLPATSLSLDRPDPFALPSGTCAVELDVDGKLAIDAVGAAGGTLTARLDVGPLRFVSAAPFEAGAYVIELGSPGWLDLDALGVGPDESIVVTEGGAIHTHLVRSIVRDSAIFADGDGDSTLSEFERAVGAVATSEDPEDDDSDTDADPDTDTDADTDTDNDDTDTDG